MSTTSKEIAEQIIAQNGYYADDPRVRQVIKYTNRHGGESYALLYREDVLGNRYAESDYVIKPEIIWSAK